MAAPLVKSASLPAATWSNRPLVGIDATLGGKAIPSWERLRGVAVRGGGGRGVPDYGAPAFIRLTAAEQPEAELEAQQLSAGIGAAIGDNVSGSSARMTPAFAVLQAADGAYYATRLATMGRFAGSASVDDVPAPPLAIRSIRALHPDVRAVVGARDVHEVVAPS